MQDRFCAFKTMNIPFKLIRSKASVRMCSRSIYSSSTISLRSTNIIYDTTCIINYSKHINEYYCCGISNQVVFIPNIQVHAFIRYTYIRNLSISHTNDTAHDLKLPLRKNYTKCKFSLLLFCDSLEDKKINKIKTKQN